MRYKTPIFSWCITISAILFVIGAVCAAEKTGFDHLTWSEIMVSIASFLQMVASLGAVPFIFIRKRLILTKRSWAIFCLGMTFILVRRSLSIWSYMGYERVTLGEMSVAAILSLIYVGFEASVLYDTLTS